MDPAFFTVRTPHARTHQHAAAGMHASGVLICVVYRCMHERTGMHEPACMLAAAAADAATAVLAAV